jgi:hypothetical protein
MPKNMFGNKGKPVPFEYNLGKGDPFTYPAEEFYIQTSLYGSK